jgi:hypothetical protein
MLPAYSILLKAGWLLLQAGIHYFSAKPRFLYTSVYMN